MKWLQQIIRYIVIVVWWSVKLPMHISEKAVVSQKSHVVSLASKPLGILIPENLGHGKWHIQKNQVYLFRLRISHGP